MYAPERRSWLVAQARAEGRLSVVGAAAALGVTPETIRRDLESLARAGALRRVHGGAVPAEAAQLGEIPLAERDGAAAEQKDRIAAAALALVPVGPDATMLLDAGSTTQRLAALLPPESSQTIITDSVPAAALLSSRTATQVHILGGRVRGLTQASVGAAAVRTLQGLRADIAFMGTNGLSVRHGLSTPDADEAEIKRAMVQAASTVVLLADARKLGAETLISFADLADIDVIVTDAPLPDSLRTAATTQGIEVITA